MSRSIRNASPAIMAALILTAGACSSSSTTTASARSSKTSSRSETYTVGVLTDLTGAAASSNTATLQGIKAGVGLAARQGYHINYIVADTTTTPAGALAAAQRLVDEDHVFAVIMISALGFAAAPFLTQHGIPVIGANIDGPEWLTSRNMFSVLGYGDYARVTTVYGQVAKRLGGKVFGGVAYGIEPSSVDYVKSAAASAQLAGLKVGYIDANLPIGTTNIVPMALAMKAANVDIIVPAVAEPTEFALAEALEQQGVKFTGLMGRPLHLVCPARTGVGGRGRQLPLDDTLLGCFFPSGTGDGTHMRSHPPW